ncbi:MAG: DNA replication/repair protein RecF [Paludibacteraceae bacterium]|nr:DNA replication/repair protein RecF [Paludibacteraceae bacterium]
MYLTSLNILNFKNIEEAELHFSPNINCLVGNNGMGKTNVLDAVYYLSLCKSAFNSIDSQNIRHESEFALIQGVYRKPDGTAEKGGSDEPEGTEQAESVTVTCGIRRGQKKQFRLGRKDYKRLQDHIGLIPLVMVSPKDSELVIEGSDERRRFMDGVIAQQDRPYLEHLTDYNALLKQRNALLKQTAEEGTALNGELFEVIEEQLARHATYIFSLRTGFIQDFIPVFQELYDFIAEHKETVSLTYRSQLQERELTEAFRRTRQRDLALGWTSQGIHKDDLDMRLGGYPLRQVASQGQQKTYLIALKLAQALWLSRPGVKPLLLLDDIFDKLDPERVERIIALTGSERFGQLFITDTDRQHLSDILQSAQHNSRVFHVENGQITAL